MCQPMFQSFAHTVNIILTNEINFGFIIGDEVVKPLQVTTVLHIINQFTAVRH